MSLKHLFLAIYVLLLCILAYCAATNTALPALFHYSIDPIKFFLLVSAILCTVFYFLELESTAALYMFAAVGAIVFLLSPLSPIAKVITSLLHLVLLLIVRFAGHSDNRTIVVTDVDNPCLGGNRGSGWGKIPN